MLNRHRTSGLILLVSALFVFIFSTDVLAMQEDNFKGYFSAKYKFRTATSGSETYEDSDLYEYIRFDLGSIEDSYEIHFYGSSRQDIDGGSDTNSYSPFEDIGDARDMGRNSYIYDAHVAINRPIKHISQLRIGRQSGTRDEQVLFDGVSVDMAVGSRVFATVYGGAATHLEELDEQWGRDTLTGAGMDISTPIKMVISLDYLNVMDKRGASGAQDTDNNLYALKIWQRFNRNTKAMIRYRLQDDESRDVKLKAIGTFPTQGFEAHASYFRQLNEQAELSSELAGYFDVIGNTVEYESYELKLRKFFGDHYSLDMGYYVRALVDDNQASYFNREYTRSYATFDVMDRLFEGLTVSVTAEQWDSEANSVTSGGLDATFAQGKGSHRTRYSAGTYYSLYKYDHYAAVGESDDVQTYYASAAIPVMAGLSASGKYEMEKGSDDFHTLTFGVRYDF